MLFMRLEQYFQKDGRGSQSRLARMVGVYPSDVSDWKVGRCLVPVRYCKAVEKATDGLVTVQDLRPDDWQVYWGE